MAKNKKVKTQSYFFMSVDSDEITVNSAGDSKALSAAFAHLIVNKQEEAAIIQKILADAIGVSAGILRDEYTTITEKGNILPKKKSNPKQMDEITSDEPFVKTRKKSKSAL